MTQESNAPRFPAHPMLIPALERICALAGKRGITVSPCSEAALKTFREFAPTKQDTVLAGLKSYEEILSRNPVDASERDMTLSALLHFGLKLRDRDFFTNVIEDDVIEIYTPQGLLLYRNFSAYRHTSYSLLDLLVYEWFVLYERDMTIVEELLNHTKEILLNGTVTEKFRAPPHLLRERHLNCKKVLSGELGYICPLQDENTGRNTAVIITARIHDVLLGDAADKIAWIHTAASRRPSE